MYCFENLFLNSRKLYNNKHIHKHIKNQIMSLSIKIISALLTRDTEMFSNMDPYCIIEVGSHRHQTKTCKEGGKKPAWE